MHKKRHWRRKRGDIDPQNQQNSEKLYLVYANKTFRFLSLNANAPICPPRSAATVLKEESIINSGRGSCEDIWGH